MDARQRADDALEALTALRSGPLADVRGELKRAGHASLAKVEALEESALAALEAELRKVASGEIPPAVPEPPAKPAGA